MKTEPANVIPPGPGPKPVGAHGDITREMVSKFIQEQGWQDCDEGFSDALIALIERRLAFFPVAAPSVQLPLSNEAAFLFDLLAGEGFFDVADWTVGEREDCLCILAKFFASRSAPVAPLDEKRLAESPADFRNRVGMFMLKKGCVMGRPVDPAYVQDWIEEFALEQIESLRRGEGKQHTKGDKYVAMPTMPTRSAGNPEVSYLHTLLPDASTPISQSGRASGANEVVDSIAGRGEGKEPEKIGMNFITDKTDEYDDRRKP